MENIFIFGAKYLYLFAIAAAIIYFFKQPKAIRKEIAVLAVIALPAIYLVAKAIAFFYYDPRPFVLGNFTPLIPHAADNGFPSDHTLLAAAFAAIFYPFNKKFSVLLWLLTLFIAVSRVYVGIHHFIDIFGSLAIAIVVTMLTYRLILIFKNRFDTI